MTNIARHWRAFRSDPPGRRFANHFSRMRRGSWVGAIARVGLGLALVVAGIVLLVVPGPGLLVMLFGVGLIAGESQRFAGLLDRAEPQVRQRARRARRWWLARSLAFRVAMVSASCAIAAGGVVTVLA